MSRWLRIARLAQEGSVYALLLLLPFSNAGIEITFSLLLVAWLGERLLRRDWAQSLWADPTQHPLGVSVVAYLAICAASIAVSDFPGKSVSALFLKWGEYLLMFVVMADVANRQARVVRRGLVILIVSLLLVLFEAIGQEITGRGPLRGFPLAYYGRMTGPYRDPINLATYLMVLFPVVLMEALRRRRAVIRCTLWALLLVLLGCLIRTETLGAWLGLGIGFGAIMIRLRAVRRLGVALLFVIGLTGAAYLQHNGRLQTIFSPKDLGTADRLVMWQAAIGMIKDRPILGHGLNTFMADYLAYWVGGERQPRYAHNCYLQVAAETGIIGLSAFVALLWYLFARLLARLHRAGANERSILVGFIIGLLAFAAQAAVDTNFYVVRQATLFWVLAGLALGFHERATSKTSSPG